MLRKFIYTLCVAIGTVQCIAQTNPKLQTKLDQMAKDVEPKVIEWRRHFHQYPELSNREVKTAAKVAEHLKSWE